MVSSSKITKINKTPKIIKKNPTFDDKFFELLINERVKKVVDMLISVHGIHGKRKIYIISKLEDCWNMRSTIPLKRDTYINLCLSLLRDPAYSHDTLRKFNVLTHNECGDYMFGHPVIVNDNQRTGSQIDIQYSCSEVIIGTVTTEQGLVNGFINTGKITFTSVRCTFLEYSKAKKFYDMFILN